MATAQIDRLILRTHFPTAQILDWINQALLYMHAGHRAEWFVPLKAVGIRTATDLILSGSAARKAPSPAGVPVADADALQTIAEAIKSVRPGGTLNKTTPRAAQIDPTPDLLREIYTAVWGEPNLVYLIRYHKRVQRDLISELAPAVLAPMPAGLPGANGAQHTQPVD